MTLYRCGSFLPRRASQPLPAETVSTLIVIEGRACIPITKPTATFKFILFIRDFKNPASSWSFVATRFPWESLQWPPPLRDSVSRSPRNVVETDYKITECRQAKTHTLVMTVSSSTYDRSPPSASIRNPRQMPPWRYMPPCWARNQGMASHNAGRHYTHH